MKGQYSYMQVNSSRELHVLFLQNKIATSAYPPPFNQKIGKIT